MNFHINFNISHKTCDNLGYFLVIIILNDFIILQQWILQFQTSLLFDP